MDKNTLLSWIEVRRVPRSTDSFDVLGRIERRYRLPEGYFGFRQTLDRLFEPLALPGFLERNPG